MDVIGDLLKSIGELLAALLGLLPVDLPDLPEPPVLPIDPVLPIEPTLPIDPPTIPIDPPMLPR